MVPSFHILVVIFFSVLIMWSLLFFFTLQRFAAVIMRIRDPKTTALIFASGKMVNVCILEECGCQNANICLVHITWLPLLTVRREASLWAEWVCISMYIIVLIYPLNYSCIAPLLSTMNTTLQNLYLKLWFAWYIVYIFLWRVQPLFFINLNFGTFSKHYLCLVFEDPMMNARVLMCDFKVAS